MSKSHFLPAIRILAVAVLLNSSCINFAWSQAAVAVVADSPVTTIWETIMQTLTQAKNVADEAWQSAQSAVTGLIQTNTLATSQYTAATPPTVAAAAAAQIAANQAFGTATNDANWSNTQNNKFADEAREHKVTDNAVAVCGTATLAAGLGNAAIQVAKILQPSLACVTNITSVRGNVGIPGSPPTGGVLLSDCNVSHNPTKSLPQQVQEVATDINTFFCDSNSNASCAQQGSYPHADTQPVSFFKDRTFNDTEMLGFDQFEKYVCGLVPENTPKSSDYYKKADGMQQLANQETDVARRNLCLQSYNEFYANHLPVVDATTNAAIAAVYHKVTAASPTGVPYATSVSAIPNAGVMSREELLHALYQGIAEGQDSSTNIFTQIAGLEALPTLKMIAAELIINNYMLYDVHEKTQESNMYLSIIAKQSLGSGLH